MRKTILYLVILGLLGFAVYFFLFNNRESSPYSEDEAGFTIKDTSLIGKIYLASQDGESVTIERTDSFWMVNKLHHALPSTLNRLLLTLKEQKPLYPVTQNAYENAIKIMSTEGIKVEIYGRDGKKMRCFYVGGVAVNNSGTNMLMDGAKKPYVVQMAGFNGYLTPHYPTQIRYWRDRLLINIPAEQLKRVSLQYFDKPMNSFELIQDGSKITVTGDSNYSKYTDRYNTRRAKIYTKFFSNINCEGYLNGLADMDTTLKTTRRHSVLDIEGNNGQRQHMEIYWVPINKRSKNLDVSDPDVPDDYDADRLYAVVNNNKDTVMIQQFVFKNMFRKLYEFYQADVDPSQTAPPKTRNAVYKKN